MTKIRAQVLTVKSSALSYPTILYQVLYIWGRVVYIIQV